MQNPIIVALDGISFEKATSLQYALENLVWGKKINDAFTRNGISVFCGGGHKMVDMKFYDIPNTVANHCKALASFGVDIVTVHAHGGVVMMNAAARELPGKIAAVTVLTSFSEDEYRRVHCCVRTIAEQVCCLASDAKQAGCEYIVCSAHELKALCDIPIKKIVPGIRPEWHQKADDQKRVMTPKQAMDEGATYLVIGRPIVEAEDPVAAAEKTLRELGL